MRFLLTIFALLVTAVAPATAAERISVSDIYNFVENTNHAINNPNRHVARNHLARTTADNAIFVNHVAVLPSPGTWQAAWASAYSNYSRYPLNPYYTRTSTGSFSKWQTIDQLEVKKRTIPGYQAQFDVTQTEINAYGTLATVDVDLKEYSLAYTPYNPTLTTKVMHANSKCKLYLSKAGNSDIVLSRMDCNTNTNLPF